MVMCFGVLDVFLQNASAETLLETSMPPCKAWYEAQQRCVGGKEILRALFGAFEDPLQPPFRSLSLDTLLRLSLDFFRCQNRSSCELRGRRFSLVTQDDGEWAPHNDPVFFLVDLRECSRQQQPRRARLPQYLLHMNTRHELALDYFTSQPSAAGFSVSFLTRLKTLDPEKNRRGEKEQEEEDDDDGRVFLNTNHRR